MLQKIKNIPAKEWIFAVFFIINTALVVGILFSQCTRTVVRGGSMNPTLQPGNSYLAVRSQSVQPGDIVVADSNAFGTYIVKRVIAVPGDVVAIENNVVYRNGAPLVEDYIAEPMVTQDITAVRLSEGEYFLMGDNRNHSADSRVAGMVSREEIRYVIPMENQPRLMAQWIMMIVLFAFGAVALSQVETVGIVSLIAKMKTKKKEVTANA